ncbi:DUF6447 family protein [Nitratiruptor sp. SB155-2]|uniref:DUF6447 family protein n=1 Tax=Nitratiruptor sp. (strain SB155-2) TaxID=387092 RepID=UPI0001586FDD|nr:DUF6447 family protein [Nitratiruptor sp. SB155-2]BAF70507.1 conserved hypothetical protein [Nitratiruptor sp. SB155-2]
MATVTIDGKEYAIEELPDAAKAQIMNIQYVDQKIADLKSQIAVMTAAREYYSTLLKANLPKEGDDTVKYEE